ncbi:MAG: hypothetical protein LBT59_25245, partial [Clostridiales bacterium]|nr:hypothetical protein [Clostridiales bacterium]
IYFSYNSFHFISDDDQTDPPFEKGGCLRISPTGYITKINSYKFNATEACFMVFSGEYEI